METVAIRLLHFIIAKKKALLTFFVVLVALGALWGAFYSYTQSYSRRAFRLLEGRPWSEAEEVIAKYPRSDAAVIAQLAMGKKALEEEKWDEAIGHYKDRAFQNLSKDQAVLRVVAIQNLALAYRGKQEWDRALMELRRAEKDPENKTPDYTRLLISQVLWEKGEIEESKKLLESLSKEALQPEVRKEAEAHLEWINAPKKS
ncbi:MAG: hypothetical protein HYT76_05010 [Deltaproteobacteria bacterium]|nr:hypothetical protein [Deltaproteobacteria bacterium]